MNYSEFIKSIPMPACILSIEKKQDNNMGDIRIAYANDIYKANNPPHYYDGIIYSELVPKERNFETFSYISAFEHKQMHAYVEIVSMGIWMEQFYTPLVSDNENIGFCMFSYSFTENATPEKLGNVNISTANSVLKSCALFRTSNSFKEAADSVIEELAQKSGALSAILLSVDEETKTVSYISGKNIGRNDEEAKKLISAIPYEVVMSWKKTVSGTNCLVIQNEADMEELSKRNKDWADSLKGANVNSLCFVPLYHNKYPIGYLYVVNFDTNRTPEVKELIELTSFFLAAELNSHNLMEKLEFVSKTDMLTGVFNRNAMNLRVDDFVADKELSSKPFGVAFVDLNGLKRRNDDYGHEAGDHMLWATAQALKEVFSKDEIYRAGGDEFSVICHNNSEKDFNDKINSIKEKTTYPSDIPCAIGKYYTPTGGDIRLAMHYADVEMYKNKEQFYKEHPELKARK
ncbi:diguanylate cyclase (GGDEF) domain-containing protein [Butyrivibrio hungatei DSM 14810]|uniref:Diguanylate cyclase (GGDEF) domain-containing protein n=1 Tax=Butyrivibrio hungatei DSM 14810 TaxID=1121132 RepID=A0A1M7SNG1_9FIRM|nr:sensor domain-containing diguanylate cyclase [Butyrivibrio hungatei]SHN60000.1 diguanylate cyclase (GGDEF) domain-containing protein [Butyrivibrio hungatei DSM 14810]